jgi:hypothetical protein
MLPDQAEALLAGALRSEGNVSSSRNKSVSRFRDDAWRRGGYRRPDGRGDYLGLLLTLSAAHAAPAHSMISSSTPWR